MHTACYVWSSDLQAVCDGLLANPGRSSLVHELHRAAGLLNKVRIIQPEVEFGSRDRLERYHTPRYLDAVLSNDPDGLDHEVKDRFGLVHDCPTFPSLASYVSLVAAATSTACRQLVEGSRLAIAWDGGRHHAQRDKASGFCYVADIVLGVMLLAKEGRCRTSEMEETSTRRPRIMYLDLDLHHGDGVAKAFHSPTVYLMNNAKRQRPAQVLTLSVHHSSPTFFPAPTLLPAVDTSSPFTLALPLSAYPSCATYARVLNVCVDPIRQAFDPDYIVLQLGADGLPGDTVGQWGAWDIDGIGGMAWCAQRVQEWNLPTCVLGGGGYHHANAARAWTKVTAALIGEKLDDAVPHHERYDAYGPSFQMDIDASNAVDQNTDAYLSQAQETFQAIARRIRDIVG